MSIRWPIHVASRNSPGDVLRDPNISDPTIAAWFDIDAFQQPPIGRFGTAGTGIIKGPGENLWHAGLYKYFRVPGGSRARKLRVELTAVNVFNHPNWGNPNITISSRDSAGRISSVGGPNTGSLGDKGGPRALRLSTRLEW
jgi:L-ascorbate metabolism protein UlaG (beta-lactamase superfamily)